MIIIFIIIFAIAIIIDYWLFSHCIIDYHINVIILFIDFIISRYIGHYWLLALFSHYFIISAIDYVSLRHYDYLLLLHIDISPLFSRYFRRLRLAIIFIIIDSLLLRYYIIALFSPFMPLLRHYYYQLLPLLFTIDPLFYWRIFTLMILLLPLFRHIIFITYMTFITPFFVNWPLYYYYYSLLITTIYYFIHISYAILFSLIIDNYYVMDFIMPYYRLLYIDIIFIWFSIIFMPISSIIFAIAIMRCR